MEYLTSLVQVAFEQNSFLKFASGLSVGTYIRSRCGTN